MTKFIALPCVNSTQTCSDSLYVWCVVLCVCVCTGNTASEGSPKGGIEARIPEGSVLRPEEGELHVHVHNYVRNSTIIPSIHCSIALCNSGKISVGPFTNG